MAIRFKHIEPDLQLRMLEVVKIQGYYRLKVAGTSANVFWHKFQTYAAIHHFLEANPLFTGQTIIDKKRGLTQ